MAGNNGPGEGQRTLTEDGQSWTRVAQEVKAIQEDIKALVANSRQRLLRAVDEEMRRALGEAMAWLSEASATELLPQSREPKETPLLETEQAPVPEVDANAGEDRQAGAPMNSQASLPKMETLAEVVIPEDGTRGHTGTRNENEMEDHEAALLEVATSGPVLGSDETYLGTVQIAVAVGQSSSQALHFVDEICRHPSLRLQRLLGSPNGVMDLWVLLRESMALKEELLGMEGVSQVNRIPAQGDKGAGVRLEVRLNDPVYGN